jgi:hypothetical protein
MKNMLKLFTPLWFLLNPWGSCFKQTLFNVMLKSYHVSMSFSGSVIQRFVNFALMFLSLLWRGFDLLSEQFAWSLVFVFPFLQKCLYLHSILPILPNTSRIWTVLCVGLLAPHDHVSATWLHRRGRELLVSVYRCRPSKAGTFMWHFVSSVCC